MRQAEPPSGAGRADADTAQCDVFKHCEGSSLLRTRNVKSNFGSSHLPVKSAPHSATTRYFSGSLSLSHNRVNTNTLSNRVLHNAFHFRLGDVGVFLFIQEDLADLFGVRTDTVADFVRVAALKKGIANKRLCPCGSALRVGKCHHMRINDLRKRLGRQWFRFLYGQVRSG
jgi:hypothetical protein